LLSASTRIGFRVPPTATPMLFVEQLPISFFPIPKRDGRIRWISDFKARDRAQHHQVYQMPLLSELTTESRAYKPLPMGLSASPQDFMKTVYTYPFVVVTTDALLSSPDYYLPLILKPLQVPVKLTLLLNRTAGQWPTTHASSTPHSGNIPRLRRCC